MKPKVIIYGCGDYAHKVKLSIERDGVAEILAFTVHREYRQVEMFAGLPVLNFEDVTQKYNKNETGMFVAIAYKKMNYLREIICNEVTAAGFKLINYISPHARLWGDVRLGRNIFIDDGVIVGHNCEIGNGVLFFMGCTLAHDIVVRKYVFFAPEVAVGGFVTIGDRSFLGIHATIMSNLTIAPCTLIGCATNIISNTQHNCVYVGNPGKVITNRIATETTI
jgi:sugar O-acyltransferase (sialic acid O-acetyltransferase NeuD family)